MEQEIKERKNKVKYQNWRKKTVEEKNNKWLLNDIKDYSI